MNWNPNLQRAFYGRGGRTTWLIQATMAALRKFSFQDGDHVASRKPETT